MTARTTTCPGQTLTTSRDRTVIQYTKPCTLVRHAVCMVGLFQSCRRVASAEELPLSGVMRSAGFREESRQKRRTRAPPVHGHGATTSPRLWRCTVVSSVRMKAHASTLPCVGGGRLRKAVALERALIRSSEPIGWIAPQRMHFHNHFAFVHVDTTRSSSTSTCDFFDDW